MKYKTIMVTIAACILILTVLCFSYNLKEGLSKNNSNNQKNENPGRNTTSANHPEPSGSSTEDNKKHKPLVPNITFICENRISDKKNKKHTKKTRHYSNSHLNTDKSFYTPPWKALAQLHG